MQFVVRSRTTNSAFRANEIAPCGRNRSKMLFCMIKISECLQNKREIELRAKGRPPCFMQAMPTKSRRSKSNKKVRSVVHWRIKGGISIFTLCQYFVSIFCGKCGFRTSNSMLCQGMGAAPLFNSKFWKQPKYVPVSHPVWFLVGKRLGEQALINVMS